MLQLARASDGNHAFAREPTDLMQIFNKEFDDVLGSCAQTVSIDIELKPGVRAVRALSRDGADRRAARAVHAQPGLCGDRALRAAGGRASTRRWPPTTSRSWASSRSPIPCRAAAPRPRSMRRIRARFSASDAEVKAGLDPKVAEAVVEQVTRERTQRAVTLQDQGKIKEARELLMQNAAEIQSLHGNHARALAAHARPAAAILGAGSAGAPATAEPAELDRKLLRQLDAPTANAGVRY